MGPRRGAGQRRAPTPAAAEAASEHDVPRPAARPDLAAQLGQLATLRQHGLLTEAECEAARGRLMNG